MRRRTAALVAAAALLAGCGGEDARPDEAAKLVPRDALAYVHADLEDGRLVGLAAKFPAVRRLAGTVRDLAGPDVLSWMGDEAAVALLDSGRPAADTLVLVEIEDEAAAKRAVRATGPIRAQIAGGYLAVGQARVVEQAVRLARGGGGLRRTVKGHLDAYMPAAGVRRVVAQQPGLLGAVGASLDDPRLTSFEATGEIEDEGLRVTARRNRTPGVPSLTFEPTLLDRVPKTAAGYLGLREAQPLFERLGLDGLAVGEIAAWVQPGVPAPVITAIAEVADEQAARRIVGEALGRLAERTAEGRSGRIAQLESRRLAGGLEASVLPLAPGVELSVATRDGVLLFSTSSAALPKALETGDALRDSDRFEGVVSDVPDAVEALAFADLAQLLTLGEQAGLVPGRSGSAVRNDVRRIRHVGAVATREGSDTTAEFFFEIP